MRADEAVKKQLAARLKRLHKRRLEIAAEIVMVERMIADVENRTINPNLRLRKNGIVKLTLQGEVRRLLSNCKTPVLASDIFDALIESEPLLKSSTFRSHLKRMVDSGIIKSGGVRGTYVLAETPEQEPPERLPSRRHEPRIPYSYE